MIVDPNEIDDTDRQRSTQEYLDEIMDAMHWLGLAWDEGPYFQTQRDNLYQEAAERLFDGSRNYPNIIDIMKRCADEGPGSR